MMARQGVPSLRGYSHPAGPSCRRKLPHISMYYHRHVSHILMLSYIGTFSTCGGAHLLPFSITPSMPSPFQPTQTYLTKISMTQVYSEKSSKAVLTMQTEVKFHTVPGLSEVVETDAGRNKRICHRRATQKPAVMNILLTPTLYFTCFSLSTYSLHTFL